MSFLRRHLSIEPLTDDRMHRILKSAHCTVRYRFGLVLAVDRTGQEYYVCTKAQLATMTVQHFTTALTEALSFHVR